ncbi:WGR domain-containing protein [uncultured Microscilla sp.]|uniref:WGR domain-containing protein n=1 Tax=uncultured Microscilla sp. TaxID=432653 RepID=UPI00262DD756|nr:WGR domain-containing protein [uncultured Microscilla sp.]
MKTLTKDAVKEAAEDLIEAFGTTTTLDVKNKLRQQGFQALQAEVSTLMDAVTAEESWQFNHNGRYRVYRFGPDSNDTFHKYLENGQQFWEVLASDKELVVNEGVVGTNGQMQKQAFPTNRKTIAQSKKLYQEQKQAGYAEATDQRLPFVLRKKYAHYLSKKPTGYTIGFFDVSALEKQAAEFTLPNQQTTEGYIIQSKNVGYDFTWELPQSITSLSDILKNTQIIDQPFKHDKRSITGEKIKTTKAYQQNEESLIAYEAYKPKAAASLIEIKASMDNVYKIDISFEGGDQISLSKFDLNLQQELLPVARQILMQAS